MTRFNSVPAAGDPMGRPPLASSGAPRAALSDASLVGPYDASRDSTGWRSSWRQWRSEHPKLSQLGGVLVVIATALLLSFLVKTFIAQPFSIPSGSMENTLERGDRVVVQKFSTSISHVRRGDVIVFADTQNWLGAAPATPTGVTSWLDAGLTAVGLRPQDGQQYLVKRIIGTGGDEVSCCSAAGKLEVNGAEITETYLKPGAIPSQVEFDVIVPSGHLWVMGDNRQHSGDSREHLGSPGGGFVAVDDVVGTVFTRVWPMSRWGWLANPEQVFANVPAAPAR